MTAKGGEALELAMVLLRAPGLRSALRARPLPDGVGEVLAIASGSPATLRRAAERSHHDEADLLEASRFFVQQVLLADGADAYRVLGADRHADRETLRNHHHLLQRWLHPDRSNEAEQWDSALATRVNRAWQNLRTESARTAYNATLEADVGAATAAIDPSVPARAPASLGAPAPVGAAIAAIPPSPPQRPILAPVLVTLIAITCLVLTWFALNREPPYDEPAAAAPASTPTRTEPASSRSALPVLQQGVEALMANAPADPAPAPVPQPAPEPEPPAALPDPEPAFEPRPIEASIAAVGPAAPPAAPPTAPPAATSPPTPPAVAWADETPPAPDWPEADLPSPAAPMTVALAPEPTAPPSAPAHVETDPLQLFQEAEATLRGITDWLGSPSTVEPVWLSPATGSQAAQARGSLHGRREGRAGPRLELESPNWTLDSQSATVIGAYRLGDRRRTVETGTLRVELARRNDRWHVAALQLEPAR